MPTRTRRKRRSSCSTTTTTKTTSGGTGLKCHLCRLAFKTKASFDDHCEKKHHLLAPNQSESNGLLQGDHLGKGKPVDQGTKRRGGDYNRIPPSPSVASTRSHKRKSAEGFINVKSGTTSSSGDKSKAYDDDGSSTKSSTSLTGTLDSASSLVREVRVHLVRLPESPKSNPVKDGDPQTKGRQRKKVQCPVEDCPSVFMKKDHKYINHLEIHEGLKPFVCPQCQFGYDDEIKLLEHVSVKHAIEAAFECQKCGSAFKIRRYLESHKCKQ